ncbi:MAG: hypothetical protein M3P27_09165, partial [Acidobacteriota bacterium]|nr:hypothetical protein [Acidobacteriota bacterium]
ASRVRLPRAGTGDAATRAADSAESPRPVKKKARVVFDGRAYLTAIIARESIVAVASAASVARGRVAALRGPAMVTEYSATTVIPPGFRFRSDRAGNLIIDVPVSRNRVPKR